MIDYVREEIVYNRSLIRCGHKGCAARSLWTNTEQMRWLGWGWWDRGEKKEYGVTTRERLYLCPEHNPERGPSVVESTPGKGLSAKEPPKWDCVLGPDEWGI